MDTITSIITYRFTVTERRVVPALLKALVRMAIRETDLVFGPSRRKLETDVRLSAKKPVCDIEAGTECGELLAKLLSGFLIKQVGEDGFTTRRLYHVAVKKRCQPPST